jgi:predicted Zn-ribbon and HTH transcriptional regulator
VKKRPKEPPEPMERYDTIRKYIIALLEEYTLSAKDISTYVRIPEKDVYDHLAHIKKTINKGNLHLVVQHAQCEKCGFVFKKRDRLTRPSKCPICHSSLIQTPLFSIRIVR